MVSMSVFLMHFVTMTFRRILLSDLTIRVNHVFLSYVCSETS